METRAQLALEGRTQYNKKITNKAIAVKGNQSVTRDLSRKEESRVSRSSPFFKRLLLIKQKNLIPT